MITIDFLQPSHLHPNSNTKSVAEVARRLEKRFGVIDKFTKYIEKRLLEKLQNHLLKNGTSGLHRIEQWLQAEWREFIVKELHHIKTKTASDEGRESFIDTGNYYRSLQVSIKFDKQLKAK